ncbi:hypothetical protein [Dietzia cercidiphylli]|uniref:Uncharacterized protein n=1 Tax=Dietzia cercidiphylli TaxID=498199 RepID=A0ABP4U5Z2_9ACTN|nr:hypothetical protein [Dietzia cercidiphylli]MBB1049514.1 hypothetical protein [Dietzia cercidiphylli]
MPETADLRQDLEAAQDRFEQYRISVSTAFEDRPAGELARALEAVLPDLAFHEGQAYAATVALDRLDAGADQAAVAQTLDLVLIEQQAARRSADFLAGVATVLARARRDGAA